MEGELLGFVDGDMLGKLEGLFDGLELGSSEGELLGTLDGMELGTVVALLKISRGDSIVKVSVQFPSTFGPLIAPPIQSRAFVYVVVNTYFGHERPLDPPHG